MLADVVIHRIAVVVDAFVGIVLGEFFPEDVTNGDDGCSGFLLVERMIHRGQLSLDSSHEGVSTLAIYHPQYRGSAYCRNPRSLTWRAQRICGRRICQSDGIALIGPSKLITFLWAFHDMLRQFLSELVKVNRNLWLSLIVKSFREAVGKQIPNALDILIHDVRGLHFHLLHRIYLLSLPILMNKTIVFQK